MRKRKKRMNVYNYDVGCTYRLQLLMYSSIVSIPGAKRWQFSSPALNMAFKFSMTWVFLKILQILKFSEILADLSDFGVSQ